MSLHMNNLKNNLKKISRHSGRIYSMAGILCVAAVIIGAAVYTPGRSQAAPVNPTGWNSYPKDSSTQYNWTCLGDWEFNSPYGSVTKLSDLEFIGTEMQDGVELPCAAIETEEQLRAVLSGLKTTQTMVSDNLVSGQVVSQTTYTFNRSQRVIFKLMKDMNYSSSSSMPCVRQTAFGKYSGPQFEMDTFDGQGHTITCYSNNNYTNNDCTPNDVGVYRGGVFGRVNDATIRNLKVKSSYLHLYYNVDEYKFDVNDYKCIYTVGGLCAVANNARLLDIETEVKVEMGLHNDRGNTSYRGFMFASGGVAGCIQSDVTIRRCEDKSDIYVSAGAGRDSWTVAESAGGIAGQITGSNNQIIACYAQGKYSVRDSVSYNELGYSHFGMKGSIFGQIVNMGTTPAVTVKDCVGNMRAYGASIGAANVEMVDYYTSSAYYYTRPQKIGQYTCGYNSKNKLVPYMTENSSISYPYTLITHKKERINDTDWGYSSGTHYLLHPYGSIDDPYTVDFGDIELSEPYGDKHTIQIAGTVNEWFVKSGNTNTYTQDAEAYLHITTDDTDPQTVPYHTKQTGHEAGAGKTDLELKTSLDYPDVSKELTIRARMRVVFNPGKPSEYTVWSPERKKVYDPSDLFIAEPTLEVSMENQAYEIFESTTAYPLGTTKFKLTPAGELGSSTSLYYYAGNKSGLVLGDTDSETEGTISKNTMTRASRYTEPVTLIRDMVKNAQSNQVYLYVLAYVRKDNVDYYKLYEYDIVVFAKDELIVELPSNGSRVPNDSDVVFMIGNFTAGEYPYDRVNVLVSREKKTYSTLQGENGVVSHSARTGDGSSANPYFLTATTKLSGSAGETFYVYVEPFVNENEAPEGTLPYKERYGRFVQEYTYTIMDKATGLTLSPSTITTAQAGSPASVPINEKIYMYSSGKSDIIIYDTMGNTITPRIVTDEDTLAQLDAAGGVTVGENMYCWLSNGSFTTASGNVPSGEERLSASSSGEILYVRCNGVWYSISNAGGLNVYHDGSLYYDSSYAGKLVYISTLLFSAGYDPSDNLIYKYQINEQDAVEAPTALLADGSSISMNKTLNFSCGANCIMYYTTDGKEPNATINEATGELLAGVGTYRYYPSQGIAVTEEAGFIYGNAVTIKIRAYPVKDAAAETPIYNSDKKSSALSSFTYTIIQQNQVEMPVAYPQTSAENVTTVINGDRISLSCTTSGVEIYYTVNGSVPIAAQEYKYTDAIVVSGDYGSYFTVKAIAHRQGMRDSEVATYMYKIADKNTVSGVTAIPATTNKVVAGDKIILSTTESGADIYYTTDGTTPDVVENGNGTYTMSEGVMKYDPAQSITVPEGSGYFMIYAIAVKAEMLNSPVAQFVYAYADSVGMPYGNPSSGTVTENTQVILQCAQKEAVIYYEIAYDGAEPAEPTTSSAVFSEQAPIIITRDTRIKAFAYYNRESSAVASLTYTLAQKMDAPSSSIASGAIVPSGTTISLPTGGGKVYYTTDGSDPTDSANTAVNIGSSVVITGKAGDKVIIKACTKETGATTSELVTFTYQISQYPGGVTTDTPTGSTVSAGSSVHLMTDVTGGTIYYTTDSGSPITAGTAGSSVTLSGEPGAALTVKAVAIAPNTTMTGSYASFSYKLMEQLAAPHASLKDGTVLTEKTNVVLKANKGKIYFTIDGTDPTKASNEYTAPIVITKAMTLKAIAVEEGSENSEISTFAYTFAEKVRDIKTTVKSGTVQAGKKITLSCPTKGASIYYTTDGSDPSKNAEEGVFVYDAKEGISIHRSVNIRAIAVADGLCDSDVLSLNYQVEEVPVEIEREKAAEEEEEAGLKPSDVTLLADRRVQAKAETEDEELSATDIEVHDFISDTTVRGRLPVIPKGITLRAKEISIPGNAQEEIRNLLGDDYQLVCNYDFTLYENGEEIQPNGKIEIGIPIPEGYENADVVIVSINENNGVNVYSTRREGNYAYAEVSHLNSYAIAGAMVEKGSLGKSDLIQIMSAAAGILVLVGIGMIIVTVIRRKRY